MSKMADDSKQRLKVVHCSWATGVGAGVGRMEAYYYRFLDRELFEPVFVFTDEPASERVHYDTSIPFQYTGSENRFAALLELLADADIVQFQGGFDPLVCEAAVGSGVPVLVEVLHNIEPGGAFPQIDLSVCVSESVRSIQPDPRKAVTICNGIDLEEFPFRHAAKPDERIVLLQVSNRNKTYFNLDQLASEILSIDPRIEIWLAGPDQRGESTERLKFLGVQTDMPALYQQADMMVLFSREEPFGLVAIEAMASGCLPLVSNEGGFREIISGGVEGFLAPPNDRGAAVAAIGQALSLYGSEKWEEMRHATRKKVEQCFGIRRCVSEYEKTYLELIKKKGRRTSPGSTDVLPSPEADIGDAMLHSHRRRWDQVDLALLRMAGRTEDLQIPVCREAAHTFARAAIERGRHKVAEKIYRKLYLSGYKSPELFSEWLSILPKESEFGFLLSDVLGVAAQHPEGVLQMVERYISSGRTGSALRVLEQAIRISQGSDDAVRVFERWKEEIEKVAQKNKDQ